MAKVVSLFQAAFQTLRVDGLKVLLTRVGKYSMALLKRYVLQRQYYVNLEEGWVDLQGVNKGKTLYICGNGPSLNKTPLYLLKGEDVFCFNRFNLFYDRIAWRPTYYMVTDDLVIEDMNEEIDDIISETSFSFFPHIHPSNVNFTAFVGDYHKNVRWLNTLFPGFSDSLPHCGINKTVTNAAIQISVYLGYSRVVFLGVDLSYGHQQVDKANSREWTAKADDDPSHFDPRYFGAGRRYHNPSTDEMMARFERAKQFFSRSGVVFINAGVGGNLNIFNRLRLEDCMGLSAEECFSRFSNALPESVDRSLVENFIAKGVDECWISDDSLLKRFADDSSIAAMVKDFVVIGPYKEIYYLKRKDIAS